jgi:ABC-2 type transport system ATP-binding protein
MLHVEGIWKRFGDRDVVRDVSFSVDRGRVLGVVGPNGAGKTTSIRIALGIFPPDRGRVELSGHPLTQELRERIGYLPEERGLYKTRKVIDTVTFLGELKGLTHTQARERGLAILEQLGMGEHCDKKNSELSHGMAQLVQLTATIVHQPELVVLDEPFTALDPVNARRLKDLVLEQRDQGTTVILCTHQMNQVEELCDEVVMINDGTVALSGAVAEVRRRYPSDLLRVVCDPPPDGVGGVTDVRPLREGHSMRMASDATPDDVLRSLLDRGHRIERFEVALPSMEEIFVAVVGGDR